MRCPTSRTGQARGHGCTPARTRSSCKPSEVRKATHSTSCSKGLSRIKDGCELSTRCLGLPMMGLGRPAARGGAPQVGFGNSLVHSCQATKPNSKTIKPQMFTLLGARRACSGNTETGNTPGGTRTPDRGIRNPVLYPAELLAHGSEAPAAAALWSLAQYAFLLALLACNTPCPTPPSRFEREIPASEASGLSN